jgi:very-short-patch-repair endonuclease
VGAKERRVRKEIIAVLYNRNRGRLLRLPHRRRVLPPAEILLWERLRDERLDHLHFTRQKILGEYVVDFYCSAAHVVVELDAGGPLTDRDRARARDLETRGMRVLLFAASAVYDDLDSVVARIRKACRPAPTDAEDSS